jgi:hypothetical protein
MDYFKTTREPYRELLKTDSDSFFDKASADTGRLLDLKAAAKMIRPDLTALGLYRQLKSCGAEVTQAGRKGKIYLTHEQLEQFIKRQRRRLRRS